MIISRQQFDLRKKNVLERVIFRPPLKAPAPMANEACFLYVVHGEWKIYGASDRVELRSNEGALIRCGNYMNDCREDGGERPFEMVGVHFYKEVLEWIYKDDIPDFLKSKGTGTKVMIEKVKVDEMISKYIETLLFYFENPSLVTDELIVLKIKELILLLVNSDDSNRIRKLLNDLFHPAEYSFKEIIHTNLFADLSLEDLALMTNLSVSSFKRKFKEVFEDTPARYIKTKRLEKAAELLKATTQRITDISFDCGFNDVGHFSKSFAAHFGCAPSDYRNQ